MCSWEDSLLSSYYSHTRQNAILNKRIHVLHYLEEKNNEVFREDVCETTSLIHFGQPG